MNVWSALVLIAMTICVGVVAFLTTSTWSLLGLVPVVWLGSEMIQTSR